MDWRLFCWPNKVRLANRLKDETDTKQARPETTNGDDGLIRVMDGDGAEGKGVTDSVEAGGTFAGRP